MSKNLAYHFNTASHLEVQNNSNGDWVQVTCNTFRSYAGNRRVNGETYIGPLFYSGTNLLYEKPLNGKIIHLKEEDDVKNLKEVRKNSRYAYSNEWI
jgi:hypothetical protein|tara:strand:- start:136 stop:426 length:291 start_codon:yes stop_codon:yes gene_type:complete